MQPPFFFILLFSAFLPYLLLEVRGQAMQPLYCIILLFKAFLLYPLFEVGGQAMQHLYFFFLLFSAFYLLGTLSRLLRSEAIPCSLYSSFLSS
jgi:hypothetical protein